MEQDEETQFWLKCGKAIKELDPKKEQIFTIWLTRALELGKKLGREGKNA